MKSCKKHLKLLQILPWENMILESCFKGFRSITFMNAANSGHMVYVLAEACFWIAFLKKLAQTKTFVLTNLIFYNKQISVCFFYEFLIQDGVATALVGSSSNPYVILDNI